MLVDSNNATLCANLKVERWSYSEKFLTYFEFFGLQRIVEVEYFLQDSCVFPPITKLCISMVINNLINVSGTECNL